MGYTLSITKVLKRRLQQVKLVFFALNTTEKSKKGNTNSWKWKKKLFDVQKICLNFFTRPTPWQLCVHDPTFHKLQIPTFLFTPTHSRCDVYFNNILPQSENKCCISNAQVSMNILKSTTQLKYSTFFWTEEVLF